MKMQILMLTNNEDANMAASLQQEATVLVVNNVEHAVEKLHQYSFDALIFSAEITPVDKNKIRKIAHLTNEEMIVEELLSGTSLLDAVSEVISKVKALPKASVIITDDALKNAVFNIHLN